MTVVVLAENKTIQDKLAYYDLKAQTFEEAQPLQVYPARVLSHIFAHLGKCAGVESPFWLKRLTRILFQKK